MEGMTNSSLLGALEQLRILSTSSFCILGAGGDMEFDLNVGRFKLVSFQKHFWYWATDVKTASSPHCMVEERCRWVNKAIESHTNRRVDFTESIGQLYHCYFLGESSRVSKKTLCDVHAELLTGFRTKLFTAISSKPNPRQFPAARRSHYEWSLCQTYESSPLFCSSLNSNYRKITSGRIMDTVTEIELIFNLAHWE